jgi:hypothetical protein
LVDTFPRFAQISFEKEQAATCCFAKEFCEIWEMCQSIGRNALKFTIVYARPVSKRPL